MMLSVNAEDLGFVLSVACCTHHRDDDEQRAMLECARRLDEANNRHSLSNPRWGAFLRGDGPWQETEFEAIVHDSRVLYDDKPVPPSWDRDPDKYLKRQANRAAEVEEVLAALAEGREPTLGMKK